MQLRKYLPLVAVLAIPAAAQAQPITGWYVGAGVGVNQLLDTNLKGVPGQRELNSDIGLGSVVSLGYGLGGGMRVELEGNFRTQQSHISPGGRAGTSYSFGPMVNLLYDFNTGGSFYPYVGLGAGATWMHIPARGSSEAQIAAQGIAGVAFPLSTPGLSLTLEARALTSVGDQKFRTGSLNNPVNVSGLIGVRYAFGATTTTTATTVSTAVPAQTMKAEEARTYLVFFDWDVADLNSRAKQIIADAAGASNRLAVTRIEVAGHADASGTTVYNQGLSMRRARIVGAELVRLGVKQEAISVQAFGDTRPLVPTAPGAREPQNRRVEIVLK